MSEPEPEPTATEPKPGFLAESSAERNQWPDEPEEVDEETDMP